MTLHLLVSIAAPAPQGFLGLRFFLGLVPGASSPAASPPAASSVGAFKSMASSAWRFCPR